MGMAVESEIGAELVEGAGKPGGAEEGEDLQRFAFHGLAAGGVVEQRDAIAGAGLEEGLLQLQLFLDTGVDERLQRRLAEPLQLRALEAAGEAFHTGHAEVVEGPGFAVEDVDTGVAQRLADGHLLSALEVMISQ